MGRRGRIPKPTALKVLAGNPGKRPLNDREPKPLPGTPEPPEGMDDAARSVWDQLVPRLAEIGLATTIDGHVLGRYCEFFVLWRRAAEFVMQNGTTFTVRAESRDGQPGRVLGIREWPQAGEMRKLHQLLLVVEREFGLTPASRTRIQLEKSLSAPRETEDDRKRREFFAQQGRAAGKRSAGG
ncbi:MAG: phage terminase small subunit P27 family [Phycisphaerales bacterium]|nr:phage terminase small subunit P27 family [Phycisphaerales bacterium]